jgi:VanZ family protein
MPVCVPFFCERLVAPVIPIRGRWLAACAWTAAVVALSVLPGGALPSVSIRFSDLAAHLLVYALLAALLQNAARRPCLSCWLVVTAGCGAMGATLELVQQFVVPGRYGSVADAVANLLGAAAGSAVWIALQRRASRRAAVPLPPE